MPYAFTNCTVWNYVSATVARSAVDFSLPHLIDRCSLQEDVQSVAGGWIVGADDKLYTYVSGRALNMALDQTGLLTLRRDGGHRRHMALPGFDLPGFDGFANALLFAGFASLDSPSSDDLGSAAATFLLTRAVSWESTHRFLFVNFKGSGLRVSIQDAATNTTIPHFTVATCAPVTADTTRRKISWSKAPPRAFASTLDWS